MPRRHPLPVDSDSDMETRPPPKRSRAATKSKGQDAEPSSIGRTSSTRNRTTRASNNAAEDDGVATPVEIPSASDQLSGPARRSQRSVSARRSRGNADDADSCPDDGGAAFVPPDEDEEQEEDDDDEVMDVDEEETAPAAARKSRKSRKSRAFKAMDFDETVRELLIKGDSAKVSVTNKTNLAVNVVHAAVMAKHVDAAESLLSEIKRGNDRIAQLLDAAQARKAAASASST